jgi:hypothetical protein
MSFEYLQTKYPGTTKDEKNNIHIPVPKEQKELEKFINNRKQDKKINYINFNYTLKIRIDYGDKFQSMQFYFYDGYFHLQSDGDEKEEKVVASIKNLDRVILTVINNLIFGIVIDTIKINVQLCKKEGEDKEDETQFKNLNSIQIDNNDMELTWENVKKIGDYIKKCLKFLKHFNRLLE